MEMHKIIYETTRELLNVEDKLNIATVFLFCQNHTPKLFSDLLYSKNHSKFIHDLNCEFEKFGVVFNVDFTNKNIKSAFDKTLKKVIENEDKDGWYKAISEGDAYALEICSIVSYNFGQAQIDAVRKVVSKQLSLFK
jgi:hypothetical protein